MRMRTALTAFAVFCLPAFVAVEAKARPDITVGPAISTLGIGGDAGVRFGKFFGLRLAGNAYSTSFDTAYGGVDYDIDFNLASVGPMFDYYPFGRILRLTAGFRYNMNNIAMTATPKTSFTFGGTTYTPAEAGSVKGELDFNAIAPYLGVGVETRFIGDTLALGFESGVLFQGAPSVSLKGNGTAAGNAAFNADLNKEASQIETDLSMLTYYPVIRFYLTVQF